MKGKGKKPHPRQGGSASGVSGARSFKRSRAGLRRPSSSPSPSTSSAPRAGAGRPQSDASSSDSRCSSPDGVPGPLGTKHRNQRLAKGRRWDRQNKSTWKFSHSLKQRSPRVQNQIARGQRMSLSGQDITSCQSLHHGTYIGNETRNIEFKTGLGNYIEDIFVEHVGKYGSAFLNSGGGSLLVGVRDDGVVCGVHFSHTKEDRTRLQVDEVVKLFHPPLLPHNYSLNFLPVIKARNGGARLKVLRLTFNAPPPFAVPTLYCVDEGKAYLRRDGSVQGPLGTSVVLEWSRQMWAGRVDQLEQRLREAMTEKWFLVGEVNRLVQSVATLHRSLASDQRQNDTTPAEGRETHTAEQEDPTLSTRDSPGTSLSLCLSPERSAGAWQAHSSRALDRSPL